MIGITRQSDSAFRYYQPDEEDFGPHTEEEWWHKKLHGPGYADVSTHEFFDDARRLGFVQSQDRWNNHLIKMDGPIIHEIYPRGTSWSADGPEETDVHWMHRITNIPERPDIWASHRTLEDALESYRNGQYGKPSMEPDFVGENPGKYYVTRPWRMILSDPQGAAKDANNQWLFEHRKEFIKHFDDAFEEQTYDPYERWNYGIRREAT